MAAGGTVGVVAPALRQLQQEQARMREEFRRQAQKMDELASEAERAVQVGSR
jgi:hypothetical protein